MFAGRTGRAIIGRSAEREAIASAIATSRTGRGEVLFFCGEPGIGKSTLAQWAADCARASHLAVHWGFAWEEGGAPSYWPWIQVLRSLLAAPSGRACTANRADLRTALAQLLPELPPEQPGERQLNLEAAEARFRLMEAVRALLQLLATGSPFVLILEDLHAADRDSLQLLHYVTRHSAGLPLVLIGTFREVDARTSSAAGPLWQAARQGRLLRLARLNETEVREVVAGMSAPADESCVQRLLSASEGNPLFLTELIDLLVSRGESDLDVTLLPDTMTQVIRRQLERLPGESREILIVASALGRDFTVVDLAQLAQRAADDLGALLEPAMSAEVIRPAGRERFQFAHILFRDVLYQGLSRAQREALHRRRAEMLRTLVERGEHDRWAELATHLQNAGRAHREAAVESWRMAARHARERLAFEATVDGLLRALEIFGEGPGAAPETRCELLLELAEATLVKGAIEAGRARCADAYRLARVLEDPALMARAALTYGSAFVAAKIDPELVDYLRETLERLPAEDSATRAQVAARLAAALQPARDPATPMAMAREAIGVARATNDDEVLYKTLRSGVSALMDFAPPEERLALNREYTTLAERFGDVPEQFRGNLRRMIDASELGDRQDMDVAIEVCDDIARRLNVPHYSWKVVSCRAMRAMIRGEFADAAEYLDEAECLASRAEDKSARLTLPIQRFGLVRDSGSEPSASFQKLQPDLVKACVLFPHAEHFVMPRVASFLYQSGDPEAAGGILRADLVDRALASGDRSSLCALGEIAVFTKDGALGERVYDALDPHHDHCSHWGLMGMLWDGPVAYAMALLATSLGRPEQARVLLEQAQGIAERMQAWPILARIRARLAELALAQGNQQAARAYGEGALVLARRLGMVALGAAIEEGMRGAAAKSEASTVAGETRIEMTLHGDVWRVEFRGRHTMIRQSRGMQILYELVTQPGREFHVLDLSGNAALGQGDLGPELDDAARAAYRQQLVELESELAEAEEMGDVGRAEQARGAMEILTRELSRAFGLGGRARPTGAAAERARVNIQRRLRDTVKRIGAHLPDAGRFLENALKTGTYCSYRPV